MLVPNKAFVSYEGEDYEVDPTTFSFVESAIEQAQKEGGASGTAGATACQEAAGELEGRRLRRKSQQRRLRRRRWHRTTKVSGDLDVAGSARRPGRAHRNPRLQLSVRSRRVGALDQLESAQGEIEKALKSAHADVYVGDDDIVRRVSAEFTIEPEGEESVTIDLDLTLNGVNDDQDITDS